METACSCVLMRRKQKLREPTFTSYLNAADAAPFLRPISVLPLRPFPVTHAERASEQLTVLGSSRRWTRVRSARSRDAPQAPGARRRVRMAVSAAPTAPASLGTRPCRSGTEGRDRGVSRGVHRSSGMAFAQPLGHRFLVSKMGMTPRTR